MPEPATVDDWYPYDDKSVAEIVHEFAVVRGDLSEQYARDQLTAVIERRIERLTDMLRLERDDARSNERGYRGALDILRADAAGVARPEPEQPHVLVECWCGQSMDQR